MAKIIKNELYAFVNEEGHAVLIRALDPVGKDPDSFKGVVVWHTDGDNKYWYDNERADNWAKKSFKHVSKTMLAEMVKEL